MHVLVIAIAGVWPVAVAYLKACLTVACSEGYSSQEEERKSPEEATRSVQG